MYLKERWSTKLGFSLFYYEYLGFLGGALITLSIIPQIIRVLKLKSAHEISIPFTLLLLFGGVCWLIYGISLNLLPLKVWNTISIALLIVLLYAKLKYVGKT